MRTFAARDGGDLIPQLVQQRDGRAAHAAAGAGDDNFARVRADPSLFQRHHAEHGGETGGADDHRFTTVQAFRHRDQPVTFYARLRCQSTPVVFTHTPAGEQHLLSGVKTRIFTGMYAACKVDSWHHWEISDDFTFSRNGQCILIVQAGPVDIHGHVALRQAALLNGLHRGNGFAVLLF